MLFSLLATLLFASCSVAVSTLGGGDAVRSVAFLVFVVFVFVAGPVTRLEYSGAYHDYRLYYLDIGHNFSNAYIFLLDQAETERLTPQTQAYLGIATGVYKAAAEVLLAELVGVGGAMDPDIGAMPPSLERTNYIPPAVSIGLMLATAAAAFTLATVALVRKEVQ
jgi:hypothetical protein